MKDKQLLTFAGLAMQAIIQKDPAFCKLGVDQNWQSRNSNFSNLAKCSFLIAQAMQKEYESYNTTTDEN